MLFSLIATPANALEIIYPKSQSHNVHAASTFFVGNTTPGSDLKINGEDVKVYENGSFVQVVPLKHGTNIIEIVSQNETENMTLTYTINRLAKTNPTVQEPKTEEFPANEYIYASVVKNNTPLRAEPNENSKRLTHLNKETILMLNGKKGDYYRVSLTIGQNAWVKAENIINYSIINEKVLTNATDVILSEDKDFNYIKTNLSFHVPFVTTETEKGLNLELYNINENVANTQVFKSLGDVKSLTVNNVAVDNTSTYFIELKNDLWGYDVYYEGNTLVLKIRKAPEISTKSPLQDLIIAIDAGHGGKDYGAVGPTGIKEKDINLDIANRVKSLLEEQGAKVIMTRTEDTDVELYDRVKIAKEKNASILISVHANALPDGLDPYQKHGTSVFYYNKEAESLAQTIKDVMTKDLGTRDDGIWNCSFVLTRPTMPLSVLVEVAYMIHPYEYTLLIDDNFRQSAAYSIVKGISEFVKKSAK